MKVLFCFTNQNNFLKNFLLILPFFCFCFENHLEQKKNSRPSTADETKNEAPSVGGNFFCLKIGPNFFSFWKFFKCKSCRPFISFANFIAPYHFGDWFFWQDSCDLFCTSTMISQMAERLKVTSYHFNMEYMPAFF